MKIVDKDGNEYNYDGKITKLRSGVAYGAEDLSNWSNRRATGKAGTFSRKEVKKERKRALELSKKSGKPVRAFDGSLQSADKIKKKTKRLTPHQSYRKQRRKLLALRRSKSV